MDGIASELLGGLLALNLLILTWGHFRMSALSTKIEDLDARKINTEEFHEVRDDVKEILKQITNLKVEQALWQGRAEAQNNKHSAKS